MWESVFFACVVVKMSMEWKWVWTESRISKHAVRHLDPHIVCFDAVSIAQIGCFHIVLPTYTQGTLPSRLGRHTRSPFSFLDVVTVHTKPLQLFVL